MELGKRIKEKYGSVVLSVDYLGTLAGVVAFPIIIFPHFELFSIGFLVAFLNACVALVLYFTNGIKNIKIMIPLILVAVFYLVALINGSSINQFILKKMYYFNL